MASLNDGVQAARKPRLLFIQPGPVPPHDDERRNALFHLGNEFSGALVTVTWLKREEARSRGAQYESVLGGFTYHATSSTRLPGVVRMVWEFVYFVAAGVALSVTKGRFDAIVAYGPFKTAFAALVIRALTGTPIIIEIPGNPHRSFTFDRSLESRLKRKLADRLLPYVFRRADHLHLLYPNQLGDYAKPEPGRVSVFHDFVALSLLPSIGEVEDTVLFLGYPWMLKGVDILIPAFRSIAPRHPTTRLLIMGHCPDRAPFERLAGGDPAITFRKAVPHAQAMNVMASCRVFVLPSRTEAAPRVLLEAMALRKPCVASSADGMPFYLTDGETGLIFRTEDIADLARQLDRVLSDDLLSARIAKRAQDVALRSYSEDAWRTAFTRMVYATTRSSAKPESRMVSIGRVPLDEAHES